MGAGAGPYNYSDMTGQIALSTTAPQGTWTVVFDSGGTEWGTISWNTEKGQNCPAAPAQQEPAGTSITVRARTAATQAGLGAATYVNATNGVDINVPDGRFIQIEVKLTPNAAGDSPILCDLTVQAVEPPTPTPTATPPPTATPEPPLGGIGAYPDSAEAPLDAAGSTGGNSGALAAVLAAVTAGAIALGSAAWYARRRWIR